MSKSDSSYKSFLYISIVVLLFMVAFLFGTFIIIKRANNGLKIVFHVTTYERSYRGPCRHQNISYLVQASVNEQFAIPPGGKPKFKLEKIIDSTHAIVAFENNIRMVEAPYPDTARIDHMQVKLDEIRIEERRSYGIRIGYTFRIDTSSASYDEIVKSGLPVLEISKTTTPSEWLSGIVEYHKNGKIKYTWTQLDDEFCRKIRHGEFMEYYNDGQLLRIMHYDHGKSEGPYIEYHHNGQVAVEGQYQNDLREGPWKFYSDSGQYLYGGNFNNGSGEVFFADGSPKSIEIRPDSLRGYWKKWYPNGIVEYECYFDMTREAYLEQRWYSNGQIECERYFHLKEDGKKGYFSSICWNHDGTRVDLFPFPKYWSLPFDPYDNPHDLPGRGNNIE